MFDISLGELAVIGAVALVVIGPEKLPKVARTAGLLFGRAQRMAADFRADLERELQVSEMAELRKNMAEEAASFRDEMSASAASAAEALSVEDHRIQPPDVPAPNSVAELPVDEPAPAKPRRTRKKADPAVDVPADPEQDAAPAPVKKTRKRKVAAEPVVADLFAEPTPEALPDAKDRR